MVRRVILPGVVLLAVLAGWLWADVHRAGDAPAADGAPVLAAGIPAAADAPQGGTAVVQAPPLRPPAPEPAPGNPIVVIDTSHGAITAELFSKDAPVSVANFLQYAQEGFYDGTIFHRVIPNFMIQGGGYTESLVEKPTRPPIQNEATNGLRNVRGTLGMARRQALRSATSQFYINLAENRMLDHTGYAPMDFGYAVFGRVIDGMEVVDRIAAVKTGTKGGMDDVPLEPVVITRVRVTP